MCAGVRVSNCLFIYVVYVLYLALSMLVKGTAYGKTCIRHVYAQMLIAHRMVYLK